MKESNRWPEIEDAIERADREAFTREPPKTLKSRIGYLIRQLGSARALAQEIGVTADSVNRYRRGARKHARPDIAAGREHQVRNRSRKTRLAAVRMSSPFTAALGSRLRSAGSPSSRRWFR
jgi:hypothetical protein